MSVVVRVGVRERARACDEEGEAVQLGEIDRHSGLACCANSLRDGP